VSGVLCEATDANIAQVQAMFLDHGRQLERHAAGPLGAGLSLLYRRFTGVQAAREHGLAGVRLLADSLDLHRCDHWRRSQAGLIEPAHRGLVDGAGPVQPPRCAVDGLERRAQELGGTQAVTRPDGLNTVVLIGVPLDGAARQ
jgi:hypothetical protein